MWTVIGKFADNTERWEGLTEAQAREIHSRMHNLGAWMVRSFDAASTVVPFPGK